MLGDSLDPWSVGADKPLQQVNTLILPNGHKKAYVRLSPDSDALEVVSHT